MSHDAAELNRVEFGNLEFGGESVEEMFRGLELT